MMERIKFLHSQGMTNRKIAQDLGVHHKTVASYLSKLNLNPNGTVRSSLMLVSNFDAKCSKCSGVFPIEYFQYVGTNKGRISYCNNCRRIQGIDRVNSSIKSFLKDKYQRLKVRSKKFGITFSITFHEFIVQYEKQEGKCFYTDMQMITMAGNGRNRNSISVDKIIPSEGYILGNVVFCTTQVNSCKSDISLEDMKEWMPGWYLRVMKMFNKSNF